MAKPFTIKSVHKNAVLALRHASQLEREFDGKVKTTRRGQQYTFTVTPTIRSMWRIIVGYPYLKNKKKQKSPDARTMKAIYYAPTRAEAEAEIHRLREAALHEVKKIDNFRTAWVQRKTSHPLYRAINVELAQVEYDERFIGLTTFLDD